MLIKYRIQPHVYLCILVCVVLILLYFLQFPSPIVVRPEGGLCNRLRVIFSYHAEAKRRNTTLLVVWTQTEECNGWFLEYFEPVPNITFVSNTDRTIEYSGYGAHPNYDETTQCIYRELRLVPTLMDKIRRKRAMLGNYCAVHIRRTDHVKLAKEMKKYTSDDEFLRFLHNTTGNIYIATDNKDTYTTYKRTFPNRILFPYSETIQEHALRVTTLEDSILDLYMCVYANQFQGSGYSSFSDLIYILRRC